MARFPWGFLAPSRQHSDTGGSGGAALRAESAAVTAHRPNAGQDDPGTKIRERGKAPINWRRNLYAIFLAQALAIVAFSLRAPFLPFFLDDLGLHDTDDQALWSGLINSFGAGTMAITAPIWGVMADRYGRKPMLMRAQFAAFVTIGLMGLATEPWHLLALRMIEGMFTGTVTAATALVAASTPKERLGFGLGLIQTAVFSGSAFGPLLGGLLADGIGFRATFGVASGMMLSGGLVTLFLVRERFTPVARAADVKRGGGWKLLTAPVLLGLTLVLVAVRFASSAVQPIMPLFVEQLADGVTSDASSLAGVTLGVLGVTSAISSVYLGRQGDKRGHRLILLWCLAGSGLVYLPMALTQHPWQLIALQALFGVFAGGTIPAANALLANTTAPERRGMVFGLMASATSVGGFIGPLAGAGLAAAVGFRATFVCCGLLVLGVLAFLAWTARRRTPGDERGPSPA
jgi:DHA1 family multidrug resistance protein-like MFS transporter